MLDDSRTGKPEHISEPLKRVIESIPRPAMPEDAPKVHWELGNPSDFYVYTDAKGNPTVIVYRFDTPDNSDNSDKSPLNHNDTSSNQFETALKGGKEFRPYSLSLKKWKAPDVRALYRLDTLQNYSGTVVLVEGEKCVDALNGLGILATTAFGGCNGVNKTDFEPLRGRDVIIWPDNDEPGFKYAEASTYTLRNVGAKSITVIDLVTLGKISYSSPNVTGNEIPLRNVTGLPKGWDAADAVTEGWDELRIRNFLKEAVRSTDCVYTQLRNGNALKEFPLRGEPFKGTPPLKEMPFKEIEPSTPPFKENSLKDVPPLTFNGIPNPNVNVNVNGNVHEWGEPDMSVLNPRRKPPEFPTQLFGPFWSKWILAKAEGCSAPVDYVGLSLLSLLSGLIGCSRFISPWEGWKEPPLLWIALVGNPSSGKSPALESVLGIARKIEMEGAEAVKDKIRQFEGDALAAQCIRQSWEKDVKKATEDGYPAPALPEGVQEPPKPERPRVMASDTTPEALARLMSTQPKGLLITRDELSGWLGSFNRYSGGSGGDRAFWLEAYGARPYVIDRARNGGESVTVPSLAASIIGGIQPDKLQKLLEGDDDGLTARILFSWPDPVPMERPQRVAESHKAETALRWLNGLSLIPDNSGGLTHGLVMLTDEASEFFQAWRREHGANQPDGAIASWWGKMPGVCLRLALCFEYLWLSATTRHESFTVSISAIEAATVMIEQYLKPMAERVYGDAAFPKEEKSAATLAKWIIKNRPQTVNVRELYKKTKLAGLSDSKKVKEALAVLEESNWLRPLGFQTNGRPKGDYEINKDVFS